MIDYSAVRPKDIINYIIHTVRKGAENYRGGINDGRETLWRHRRRVNHGQTRGDGCRPPNVFLRYERHYADVKAASERVIKEAVAELGGQTPIAFTITGSGGIGLAKLLQLKFIQEVIACTKTVEELIPQTDVAIELGG